MTEFCTHSIRVPRARHWNWREATYTSQNVASSFMTIATGSIKSGSAVARAPPTRPNLKWWQEIDSAIS